MEKKIGQQRAVQPASRLLAYSVALDVAAQVVRLVEKVPAALKSQQDQAVRAVARVPLAIAEGQGRVGRDAVHYYRVVYSSAKEVSAVLQLLSAVGAVDGGKAGVALADLDRARALLWGLIRKVG